MLKSLNVTNFALIEQAFVDFSSGLNILTGETGAGKSILIDALNMILGSRTSVDFIRTGCDFFRVEAVFEMNGSDGIKEFLDEMGILLEEDQLIVSRRYTKQGKNTILVNGCQLPLATLRQLGEKLVDMHGQHENQNLLRPETHFDLLDAADTRILDKRTQYRQVYKKWLNIKSELAKIEKQSRDRMQRLDMLTWQTQEIAAAELKSSEEEKLEQEIHVLANAEKIAGSLRRSYSLLSQGSKGSNDIVTSLAEAKRELETVARYDNRIEPQLAIITDALYQLEEVATDIRRHSEEIDYDPKRLDKLQDRLDVISKLKRKYGGTIEDILVYYHEATNELAKLVNYDEHIAGLNDKLKVSERELARLALDLDKLRHEAANRMAINVSSHLQDLGMSKARFTFNVTQSASYNNDGKNEVALLFSANPGEEPKPLYKIASGGELSRIALALKTVMSDQEDAGVMVFDEVDTGIGGQTAQMVGEKIALVAARKQVLCITHLPQIACMADTHIYIEKQVSDDRTQTIISLLNEEQRLHELTRMVSGDNLTEVAIENARQMVNMAMLKKEKWKNKAQA